MVQDEPAKKRRRIQEPLPPPSPPSTEAKHTWTATVIKTTRTEILAGSREPLKTTGKSGRRTSGSREPPVGRMMEVGIAAARLEALPSDFHELTIKSQVPGNRRENEVSLSLGPLISLL
jgi:hypothetical protein